jgi:DNA polymerase-3 subunit alpha
VFDDEPSAAVEAAAKSGACGLLTVELDRRAGDDLPRVAIKHFQPLDALAQRTRLQMTVRIAAATALQPVLRELAGARGGTGAVRLVVPLAGGGQATVLAGRDFKLDGELAARLERIAGEGSVDLSAQEAPRLALVG